MSSVLAGPLARPSSTGSQTPRIRNVPPYASSAGQEAVELAAAAGLVLDPWQQLVLRDGLGESRDGRWAAFEVALVVPRQNGKGGVLEARELAGLFLFGERLILHSAHEFKTAREAFKRISALVRNTPALRRRVAKITTAHGEEGIELRSGAELRFVARSTGSGRGFTGDCVILDEAYHLDDVAMAALLPTMSARHNPQLWYASTAGMTSSTQLAAVRARGERGGDPSLAYLEWSVEPGTAHDDPAGWAQANPALGIRISEEFIVKERRAIGAFFARERLGVFDPVVSAQPALDFRAWLDATDPESAISSHLAFGLDVRPDRSWAALGVAGLREDGRLHVEVVRHLPDVDKVVAELVRIRTERQPGAPVVLDARGAAGSLLPELATKGVEPLVLSAGDLGKACGAAFDGIKAGRWMHRVQPELDAAVAGAGKRPVGDAWAFDRRADADICPLVAVTLAAWAVAGSTRQEVLLW